MRSEKAVSFFTFVKASEVKDVKKYNHAVSVLWSAGTVLFEILGIPQLFIRQNSPWAIFLVLGTMFWVIGISEEFLELSSL